MSVPVEVVCNCPAKPHETDTVYLMDRASIPMGAAAFSAMGLAPIAEVSDMIGVLSGVYLRHGVIGWTKVDDKGDEVPVTAESLERLLPFEEGGLEVAEKANDLYSEAITGPFVARLRSLSPPTPTKRSTSAKKRSGTKPRKRSKPSSSTATDTPLSVVRSA